VRPHLPRKIPASRRLECSIEGCFALPYRVYVASRALSSIYIISSTII
jgi:hypothetical protein